VIDRPSPDFDTMGVETEDEAVLEPVAV